MSTTAHTPHPLALAIRNRGDALGLGSRKSLAKAIGISAKLLSLLLDDAKTPRQNAQAMLCYAAFLDMSPERFTEKYLGQQTQSETSELKEARYLYEQAIIEEFRGRIPLRLIQILHALEPAELASVETFALDVGRVSRIKGAVPTALLPLIGKGTAGRTPPPKKKARTKEKETPSVPPPPSMTKPGVTKSRVIRKQKRRSTALSKTPSGSLLRVKAAELVSAPEPSAPHPPAP